MLHENLPLREKTQERPVPHGERNTLEKEKPKLPGKKCTWALASIQKKERKRKEKGRKRGNYGFLNKNSERWADLTELHGSL